MGNKAASGGSAEIPIPRKFSNEDQRCEILFIRHGERADKHLEENGKPIEFMDDAHLTQIGIQQAKETGLFLKSYIEENKFEEVILESSPFLRVMMTAAQIAKQLSIPKITVSYNHREIMHPSCFSGQDPIPNLLFINKDKDYLVQNYLVGVDFQETDESKALDRTTPNKMYPESEQQCHNRVQNTIHQFCKYTKELQPQRRVLKVVITHFHPVWLAAQILGGRQGEMTYCCISGIRIYNGKLKKLVFDCDDRHVKTKTKTRWHD
eukprot:403342151